MKKQCPWVMTIIAILAIGKPIDAAHAIDNSVLESVVAVLPAWDQFDAQGPTGRGAPRTPEGTGVAVFDGTFIATNQHVLGAAKAVKVRLGSGRVISAEIVGRDIATDLALLKIPEALPTLKTDNAPKLGAEACAIGNQFGLGLSMTCGIVSAYPVSGIGFNGIEHFIQTDAAINPGSSGGALVNRDGQLIGLVSAIFGSGADTNIGVNFAASIALVERVMGDIRDNGRVRWGRSGMRVEPLQDPAALAISGGALVSVIFEQGPAAKAGLKAGDVLTQINGRPVRKTADVVSAFALKSPGDAVKVTYRRGAKTQQTELTLMAPPERPAPPRP